MSDLGFKLRPHVYLIYYRFLENRIHWPSISFFYCIESKIEHDNVGNIDNISKMDTDCKIKVLHHQKRGLREST